jgi:hypothetical protein
MTCIPDGPPWCWALQGEDVVFFSQPTEAYLCLPPVEFPDGTVELGESETRRFPSAGPCVARCQHETRFYCDTTADGPTLPVQCGHVARWIPRAGCFLCDTHYQIYWCCVWCEAPLERDAAIAVRGFEGGFCSQACALQGEALYDR